MADKDDALEGLRREIDGIDDQIHDLLMRRADVTREIGHLKAGGAVYIRPGREAHVLRRLMARHRGPFSRVVTAYIWREIFGGATSLQGPFSAAVLEPDADGTLRWLARDHFGAMTPVRPMSSAAQVLRAVSERQVTVGVLPMVESDRLETGWWRSLARRGPDAPRIVARLPFIPLQPPVAEYQDALVVALAPQEETGDDSSFLVVEAKQEVSRSAIKERLSKAGLEPADIYVHNEGGGQMLLLAQISGFVAEGDPRIADFIENSSDAVDWAMGIGGYAKPLTSADVTGNGRNDET